MSISPLSGLRVLDFTSFPPGAACTVMLADLGADVIRIEPVERRAAPSLVAGQIALSRAKRSMTLDLRSPAATDILKRLAPTVDIVVENGRPGSMDARGFGFSQASQLNPRLVWCAITGFGQTGPYAEHAGHDLAYVAQSGLLGALAPDLPWHPATMLAGPAAGQAAVIAIQAALLNLSKTDRGAFLDISMAEAAGWFLTCSINPLTSQPYQIAATPDRRLYRCADDRLVAVTSAEPRTWAALCDGLGAPELKACLHVPEAADRTAEKLARIFRSAPAADWVGMLAPAGAAIAIVNVGTQLCEDPHVRARRSVLECAGAFVPASPVRIEDSLGEVSETAAVRPPLVGEHTRDVLASAGFTPAEIDVFVADGVI